MLPFILFFGGPIFHKFLTLICNTSFFCAFILTFLFSFLYLRLIATRLFQHAFADFCWVLLPLRWFDPANVITLKMQEYTLNVCQHKMLQFGFVYIFLYLYCVSCKYNNSFSMRLFIMLLLSCLYFRSLFFWKWNDFG